MSLRNDLNKAQSSVRIAELEKLVEKQGEMIERLRSTKITLPVGRRKNDKGKSYLRVVIGDTHGSYIDKEASKAFFQDLELLNPAEIVHGGDILDCAGFLAQHHTIGVVPECAYTFEQDVLAANCVLDKLEKYAPNSSKTVILGNHCQRIEKTIIKWVLTNKDNAKYLLSMFGPEKVMNLEQRGIRCIRYDQFYDGLNVRGTCKLEKTIFRHGTRAGANAAQATLNDFGCNVIYFHTHRIDMATKETIDGLISAFNPGCLCEIRPLYGLTNITGWGHGYIIQCVTPGKGHLTIQIPIINGTSYLFPLLQTLNLK